METALSRVDYETSKTQEIIEILYRLVHIAPESLNLESNLRQILKNNQLKAALLLKRQDLILQAHPLKDKGHWRGQKIVAQIFLFLAFLHDPRSPFYIGSLSTSQDHLSVIYAITCSIFTIEFFEICWKSSKIKTLNRMDQQLEFEIDQLEGEVSEKVKALQEKTKIPFFREITEELGKNLQPDVSEENSPSQIL